MKSTSCLWPLLALSCLFALNQATFSQALRTTTTTAPAVRPTVGDNDDSFLVDNDGTSFNLVDKKHQVEIPLHIFVAPAMTVSSSSKTFIRSKAAFLLSTGSCNEKSCTSSAASTSPSPTASTRRHRRRSNSFDNAP